MADDAGHAGADLTAKPPARTAGPEASRAASAPAAEGAGAPGADADPVSVGFFELLRQLETETQRFGRAGGPEKEPARLGQTARLSFAASDVATWRPGTEGGPPRVGVNVIGLLGPEGPMPLHITRWVMTRLSNRWFAGGSADATSDTTFLDFVNMLQHRMIALYWRAWAEARPEVQVEHGTGGRVSALMRTLGAIGLPGTATGDGARQSAKLRHGTSLAHQVTGPGRLLEYLADVVGAPVGLVEFVGTWTEIPARLQTRIGHSHAGLGTGAVVGGRVFERQARAEIRIGPLSLDRFTAFLDDTRLNEELRHAIRFAMGEEIAFDLRLVLRAQDVPEARLGQARLGRTTWLNPAPGRDPDDYRVRSYTGRAAPEEAAA